MKKLLQLGHMKLEEEGKLAWLTFTRETSLNAINDEATVEINHIAKELYDNPDTRVVVIRGEGRAFSTGLDLKEFAGNKIKMTYHRHWERALRVFESNGKNCHHRDARLLSRWGASVSSCLRYQG